MLATCLVYSCINAPKSRENIDDSSNVQGLSSQSPLPPLAVKIREKALELRLKEANPRALKPLAGSEGGKLPHYVKEILLAEVKSQPWTPLPPPNRPCYVDPKRKQPKDLFYALQRAAYGTTKPASGNTPDPDQGVKLSPFWSGIPWAQFLGYELQTYKLLDQLEAWFSEINADSLDTMSAQSLGLTNVPVPDDTKDYVRKNLVLNDLDLVVNGRGRDRTQLRCFLAHQVVSIASWESLGIFARSLRTFDHFPNVTDIDFHILKQAEDLDLINQVLKERPKVSGIFFDILWNNDTAHNGVVFSPKLIETKLDKKIRERITRFYARYGIWENLSPSEAFGMFPNIKQLLLRIDTASDWRGEDGKKIADFIEYTKKTKITELWLRRLNFGNDVFNEIPEPLNHLNKIEIQTDPDHPLDLSEAARVFPKAKSITVSSRVSLPRANLDNLQRQGVKVGWENVYLNSCSPSASHEKLVFNHPVFTRTNLKIKLRSCSADLQIEQAPTFDDIKNQLVHRLIGERDQSSLKCTPKAR